MHLLNSENSCADGHVGEILRQRRHPLDSLADVKVSEIEAGKGHLRGIELGEIDLRNVELGEIDLRQVDLGKCDLGELREAESVHGNYCIAQC